MDKLPRKETLLKTYPTSTSLVETKRGFETGESSEVKRANELAEIAAAKDKQVEAEIKTRLRQEGYESLEKAKETIKQKLEEANQIFEAARKEIATINQERTKLEEDKQKLLTAFAINKEREDKANARLEQAIKIENNHHEHNEKSEILKRELQEVIDYHNSHVVPCAKALRKSTKVMYALWGMIENPKGFDSETLSDWLTSGLNYIGKQTNVIDHYTDNVKGREVK